MTLAPKPPPRRRSGTTLVVGGGLAMLGIGLAIGWLGAHWREKRQAEHPVQVVRTAGDARLSEDPAPEPPPGPPTPPADDAIPTGVVRPEPALPSDPNGLEPLDRIEFPRMEKLIGAPLSAEPHEVVGAWDGEDDSPLPGRRRSFVLVVDPGISDAQLEALARDARAAQRDASLLDVRIFDDEAASRRPRMLRAGGEHLVAEVKRNDAVGLDLIRVRGRRIEP